jgi:O-antigen ligase
MTTDILPALAPRSGFLLGRLVLLAWLVYLLIAPTIGFSWIESWHNEQRAAQIVLLVITAASYLVTVHWPWKSGQTDRWLPPLALLVFLGIGILSSIRAQFQFAAFAEVGLLALLAILVLFTARVTALDPELYAQWARWFSLLFATAYVLGVATRYLAAIHLQRPIDLDVFMLGYANPRFASALHAVLIPFIASVVAANSGSRVLRAGAFAVLALLWTINVGLGTRGIWFAYAIGLPLTMFLLGWRRTAGLVITITLSAVVGAALHQLFFDWLSTGLGTTATASSSSSLMTLSSREVLWRLSWEAIVSSPLLGIGPMQFAALDNHVGAHPHNWILQIGTEWGLLCLVIAVIAVLQLGRAVRNATWSGNRAPAIVLAVAVSLALGLVDGNLVMPVSQCASALVLGLLLAEVGQADDSPARRVQSGTALVLSGFSSVVAGAIVLVFAVASLPDQPQEISRFRSAHPDAWLVPRFWEQGSLSPPSSAR